MLLHGSCTDARSHYVSVRQNEGEILSVHNKLVESATQKERPGPRWTQPL
jgi:hypothetical protein